jgi:hypothetical protein
MLQVKTAWVIAAVAFAVMLAAAADYGFRCYGAPLSRDEAVVRAEDQVERFKKSFNITEAMTLSTITFEHDSKTWLASFAGPKCKVVIVVDRCHGDSAESSNACGG